MPRADVLSVALIPLLIVAGCASEAPSPPPPLRAFEGVPVSGSLADAHRAGFTRCFAADRGALRCRRDDVTMKGQGPFMAAIDLEGDTGQSGFTSVTLWHDSDQQELQDVGSALRADGWQLCVTGSDARGDQAVYTRPGASVRFSMDISYYMKRRLRIFSEADPRKPLC